MECLPSGVCLTPFSGSYWGPGALEGRRGGGVPSSPLVPGGHCHRDSSLLGWRGRRAKVVLVRFLHGQVPPLPIPSCALGKDVTELSPHVTSRVSCPTSPRAQHVHTLVLALWEIRSPLPIY